MVARSFGQNRHTEIQKRDSQKGMLKPWRTAAEIMDWSIETPSILTEKAFIRKYVTANRPRHPEVCYRE